MSMIDLSIKSDKFYPFNNIIVTYVSSAHIQERDFEANLFPT